MTIACVTTTEFAFWCADFGWRTFFIYKEKKMKKKLTEEEIGQAIGKLAEKIRDDLDYDFRVASGQMWLAENELTQTFDAKQIALYEDFCEKRERYFALAKELYQRKF